MMCAWKELLSILPPRLRREVDILGRESMQELRLRINAPPELVLWERSHWLSGSITRDELNFVINTASRYSPWTASTASQGYITAPGGHRIGLCGDVVCRNGAVEGIREVHSLCIRIARDIQGIAGHASDIDGSILILGAPGWGKSTLLRDLVRLLAENETVCVVDERCELYPDGFRRGKRMDILTGCPKRIGIDMALRTMGPSCIAVDEITAEGDCHALMQAANCGVRLIATAHASSAQDFLSRSIYQPLVKIRIFETLLILNKDKSYKVERMTL